MGFGVTAAGIIVVSMLFISMVTSVVLVMKAFTESIKGIQVIGRIEREKLGSIMMIKHAMLDLTDNKTLYFTFTNNGTLDYYDFNSFDLIVVYQDLITLKTIIARLDYNASWWIINITVNGGYVLDFDTRRYIEPSEEALVRAVLPSPANPSQPIKIVFVNQYGSRAVYKFVEVGG